MADGVQHSGASEHNLRGPFHGVQHRSHHLWCSALWQLEEGTTGADCVVNAGPHRCIMTGYVAIPITWDLIHCKQVRKNAFYWKTLQDLLVNDVIYTHGFLVLSHCSATTAQSWLTWSDVLTPSGMTAELKDDTVLWKENSSSNILQDWRYRKLSCLSHHGKLSAHKSCPQHVIGQWIEHSHQWLLFPSTNSTILL